MNSIFGKPLTDVTYQDVVDFAHEQIPEGLNLDYKRDLSSIGKVVKTLVSFANTNGGWVIVGIEDEDDKPKLPAHGMTYGEKYELSVTNSIISSVSPIVIPQYKTVHSDDRTHTFLVVYMPMSQSAPHFMQYNKENVLFTRVSDQSSRRSWAKCATEHEWEMLRNRREKSTALRDEIRSFMDDIAREANDVAEMDSDDPYGIHSSNLASALYTMSSTSTPPPTPKGTLKMRAVPKFPISTVFSIDALKPYLSSHANQVVACEGNYYPSSTPYPQGHGYRTHQDVVYLGYKDTYRQKQYFLGMDTFGQVLNITPVELKSNRENEDFLIKLPELIVAFDGMLHFTANLYKDNAYDALLSVECTLDVHKKTIMYSEGIGDMTGWPYSEDDPPVNITGTFKFVVDINASTLADAANREAIVKSMTVETLNAFNYSYYKKDVLQKAFDTFYPKQAAK